jgi:glyoxylase-like metal-dependent hydrolase (beta-lactamase superfamily II)
MCTHLHADHVGWNTRLENGCWVPTFPNARYAMSRMELDHWRAIDALAPVNHGSLRDSVLPVVERDMALFVTGGDEILSGVSIEPLAGHTIDHLGLRVCRPEGDALFSGDAIHSPVQLVCPDWPSAFCGDAEQAVATRIAMLERAADEGTELFPAHFRRMQTVRVRRAGAAFRPA